MADKTNAYYTLVVYTYIFTVEKRFMGRKSINVVNRPLPTFGFNRRTTEGNVAPA